MRFSNSSIYQMSADKFSGIDLSEPDRAMLSGSAAMAENVFVNSAGEIEKRRGFKILYASENNVNGVYKYFYGSDKVFYILHEADCLYILEETDGGYEKGALIYSGIADKASKGFYFGDGLYIICDGYYKVCYDKFFGAMAAGRVSRCYTNEQTQCVITNRSKGSLDGEVAEAVNKEYMYHSIKFKYGRYYSDTVSGDINKLYIAKNEFENQFRVVSLTMGDYEIETYQYELKSDSLGIYIEMNRKNLNAYDYYDCEPEVVICYTGFVYAPKNIVSRLPVGIDEIDGSLLSTSSASDMYTGVYTEDLNLASPIRRINFYINTSQATDTYLRLCLDSGKTDGRVLKITAGGKVIHNYYIQKDLNDKEQVVYPYKCEYVDISRKYLISAAGSGEIAVEVEFFTGGYSADTDGCGIYGFYDMESDMRVFLAGSKKYPARDFMSGVYDASYFPALSYTMVGQEQSKILGYGRYFGYQLIFKDSAGDAKIYFREAADGGFKILKGTASEAAASENAVINLNSKLFILSEGGLYSIEATSVEGQTKTVLRSGEINPLLLGEDLGSVGLAKMDNKLVIFGEQVVYVLDAERDYNWYIYRLPYRVRAISELDGEVILYERGIAKMREAGEDAAYSDGLYSGEEAAVCAYWKTNNVCFMPLKRRDILSAYCSMADLDERSGAEIFYNTEDFTHRRAKGGTGDLFSFGDMDFSRFSFHCTREGTSVKTHLRAKRAEKFSLTVRNGKPEQMRINKIGFLYR